MIYRQVFPDEAQAVAERAIWVADVNASPRAGVYLSWIAFGFVFVPDRVFEILREFVHLFH